MVLTYFKRYRMEIRVADGFFSCPEMPPGYCVHPWSASLADAHAKAKYGSFSSELDANVFPCLGEIEGCRRLMRDISRKDGFLPGATWLLSAHQPHSDEPEYCGTIQGVRHRNGRGAVQNLGIAPEHRGRGLGTLLLHRALVGFRQAGLEYVQLEVTAENSGAIRLYSRLGFRCVRTVYKAAEVAYS